MRYSQFATSIKTQLYGSPVQAEEVYLGEAICILENGQVLVNGKPVELSSIEEAKTYIKQIKLEEDIAQSLYEEIPSVKIANLIREHHQIKVTNKLIESYLELASSKTFSVDPVVTGIRSFNTLDSAVENKIDYVLNDGSVIAISEETQAELNSLLEDKYQLVEYMRESKENFMYVLRELS